MSFLDEKFWLAISFVIFIYFAYRPVKKIVLSSLDNTIDSIKKYLLEAENLKKDASLMLQEIEKKVAGLPQIKEQAFRDAEIIIKKIHEDNNNATEKMLEYKLSQALSTINNQKLQISEDIKNNFTSELGDLVSHYFKVLDNKDDLLPGNKINDIIVAQNIMNKNFQTGGNE